MITSQLSAQPNLASRVLATILQLRPASAMFRAAGQADALFHSANDDTKPGSATTDDEATHSTDHWSAVAALTLQLHFVM
ncbi:hypothetical protein AB0H00_31805 [Nocardia sp. NPDC023852]|uniref:hypothetical protein n=1 Tax=Nocardia sp. NPDC023852 TaxID=3154697 RepID=UPI0033ED04A4